MKIEVKKYEYERSERVSLRTIRWDDPKWWWRWSRILSRLIRVPIGNWKSCLDPITDFLLALLTKLLAISRGKMNINTLYKDIAFCIYHTKPQIESSIDDVASAILGEDE